MHRKPNLPRPHSRARPSLRFCYSFLFIVFISVFFHKPLSACLTWDKDSPSAMFLFLFLILRNFSFPSLLVAWNEPDSRRLGARYTKRFCVPDDRSTSPLRIPDQWDRVAFFDDRRHENAKSSLNKRDLSWYLFVFLWRWLIWGTK